MAVSTASLAKEKDFINNNWKPILGIGATIGVTYVVWNIYKDFKATGDQSNTRENNLSEDNRFPPSTLTEVEALNIANRLQDAMGTFGKANTEEAKRIKLLLTDLNYNDYVKVSRSFGQRGYVTVTGISKDSDILAPAKNLSYWLSKELNDQDYAQIEKIMVKPSK